MKHKLILHLCLYIYFILIITSCNYHTLKSELPTKWEKHLEFLYSYSDGFVGDYEQYEIKNDSLYSEKGKNSISIEQKCKKLDSTQLNTILNQIKKNNISRINKENIASIPDSPSYTFQLKLKNNLLINLSFSGIQTLKEKDQIKINNIVQLIKKYNTDIN